MHLPMRLTFQGLCEPLANLRPIHSTSLFCIRISKSYILPHCMCLEACSVTSHKRPSFWDFHPSLAAGHKAVYAGFAARPVGQISSTVSIKPMIALPILYPVWTNFWIYEAYLLLDSLDNLSTAASIMAISNVRMVFVKYRRKYSSLSI